MNTDLELIRNYTNALVTAGIDASQISDGVLEVVRQARQKFQQAQEQGIPFENLQILPEDQRAARQRKVESFERYQRMIAAVQAQYVHTLPPMVRQAIWRRKRRKVQWEAAKKQRREEPRWPRGQTAATPEGYTTSTSRAGPVVRQGPRGAHHWRLPCGNCGGEERPQATGQPSPLGGAERQKGRTTAPKQNTT